MNLIILGASGYSKVIISIIEKLPQFKLIGLVDKSYNLESSRTVLNYPILGEDSDLPTLIEKFKITGFVIAIGDNYTRSIVAKKMTNEFPNLRSPVIIDPSSKVSGHAHIGKGTVIMPGATVNASTHIGNYNILNTNCSVDHDNNTGEFVSLGPNSTTGGNVRVGDYSVIGISATVIHSISIGHNVILGAGSTLIQNLDDNTVAFGLPAKVKRYRKLGDRYL